jgi:Cu/Zn superoxide dismutase
LAFERQFNAIAALCAALAVVGCSGVRIGMAHDDDEPVNDKTDYGQVAVLRPIGGSAVFGKIRVIDRGDGVNVLMSLMNVPPGDYRVAFTERPNCTSPNGFSAGAPWAPPGKDAYSLMPVLSANSDGNHVETSVRVPAVHTKGANGVEGRSVVVFAGRKVTDAQPGVPNERMACGVFETGHGIRF